MKTVVKIVLFIGTIFCANISLSQEVILIRHAKVALNTDGWMGYKKATQLNESYNHAPIESFNINKIRAELPAINADTIFVSALSRSISTAYLIFGDSATLLSSQFLDEFELHIAPLPLLLPYKCWTSVSRTLWFLGRKKGYEEPYQMAKQRVAAITDFIESNAKPNQQMVLVTHGFLNRNITHELKRRGWQKTENNGKHNLGATILKK